MPFGKGGRGNGVRLLQERLAEWIGELHAQGEGGDMQGLIADGAFGQNTQFVVAKFQQARGLSPSGYADAETLTALGLDENLPAGDYIIDSTGGGV